MGLLHIYCGDGKGKTTAAIGLAVRAAGAGMRVHIIQLLKGSDSAEISVLRSIPNITLERCDRNYGFVWDMTDEDKKGITECHDALLEKGYSLARSGKIDMLILPEALYYIVAIVFADDMVTGIFIVFCEEIAQISCQLKVQSILHSRFHLAVLDAGGGFVQHPMKIERNPSCIFAVEDDDVISRIQIGKPFQACFADIFIIDQIIGHIALLGLLFLDLVYPSLVSAPFKLCG